MEASRQQSSKKKFRINDIAQELNVKKSVVKQWEKELGFGSEKAFYSTADLDLLKKVKQLVHGQKMSLAQAKEALAEHFVKPAIAVEEVAHATGVIAEEQSSSHIEAAPQESEIAELAVEEIHAAEVIAVEEEVIAASVDVAIDPTPGDDDGLLACPRAADSDQSPAYVEQAQPEQEKNEIHTLAAATETVLASSEAIPASSTLQQSPFYDELSFFKQELMKFKQLLGS